MTNKPGRKPLPYRTTTVRIPEAIKPLVLESSREWKERNKIAQKPVDVIGNQ